jgi:hypothetical protein
MKKFTYLKDKSYYENLYDEMTVSECRHYESSIIKADDDPIFDGKNDDEKKRTLTAFAKLATWFISGERYEKKEETIKRWMDDDRSKDKILDDAVPLRNITCGSCRADMNCTMKGFLTQNDRIDEVIFMFECFACNKREAYWHDGIKFEDGKKCVKCSGKVDGINDKDGDDIITTYKCQVCGHIEIDRYSLKTEPKRIDEHLEEDKKRFCFSSKEGYEYTDYKYRMKQLEELLKQDEEKKKHKELYDAVDKIQKLNIVDLNNLLTKELEKDGYANLELGKPVIGKDVVVEFNVQDGTSGRKEYDSKTLLKKIIARILEKTNWRLMSDGLSYRMGFLSGRLRGFDKEADLLELVKKMMKS